MSAGKRDGKSCGTRPALRGRKGFRQVGTSARAPLEDAARRMGFAESDVLLHWPEIVGEALAGLCHPVSVSYGKTRRFGATLIVRVEGARAPEAEMMGPRIVERVNAHYGYRAVSRMKVTQATGRKGRAAGFAEAAARFEQKAPELDARTVQEAKAITQPVRDPALRDALALMGAYVMSRSKSDAAPPRRSEEK